HSEVRVGVVSAELEAIAREGAPEVDWLTSGPGGTFADLHRDAQPWREHHDDDRAIAQVLYTSGTTSAPKGCMHTHDSIVRLATQLSLNLGYEHDDRILIAMPIWHSAPLNVCLLPILLMGGTAVLQKEYHPIETLRMIGTERIT